MNRFVPLLATALGTVAAVTVGAPPGYLKVSGPPVLRFRQAPVAAKSSLPPLPKEEPSASIPMPTNALAAPVGTPEAGVATDTTEAARPGSNEVFVTPQMLVDYFHNRKVQDSHEATAIVPFGFVPPDGGSKPPSSATYHSP